MNKNQKGFSLVEGLLIFVIVGVLAGVGWYVYDSNKKAKESLTNADKSSSFDSKSAEKKIEPVKPAEKNTSGYVFIKEWGITARIGSAANSDKLTYRIAKDNYGDDTAYFLLSEEVSTKCREVGFALHRKTDAGNNKYTKIGEAYYAPSSAQKSMCDKYTDEQVAIKLLNELSASIDKYDYEFKSLD